MQSLQVKEHTERVRDREKMTEEKNIVEKTEELMNLKLQNEEMRTEACESKKEREILEYQYQTALNIKDQMQKMYESQLKQSEANEDLIIDLKSELNSALNLSNRYLSQKET